MGHRPAPLGFDFDDNGMPVIIESELDLLRRVRWLRQFTPTDPEIVAKRNRTLEPHRSHKGHNYTELCDALKEGGFVNRQGKPYGRTSMKYLCRRAEEVERSLPLIIHRTHPKYAEVAALLAGDDGIDSSEDAVA